MRTAIISIMLSMNLCLLMPLEASAQYPFGKNKIQYAPKDWKIIETPHTEIFYYPEEIPIEEFVASLAEQVYDELSEFFDIEFEKKIPIILYGTHHDFKETNIIPYHISEGTGGFTEFIKGRVALPFMGSYNKLLIVFRHEMTHAFMLQKIRTVMRAQGRFTYNHPPLWFTEGLAEYIGHGEMDSESEMFIRDAMMEGTLIPLHELWRIYGTYMMYKEGESAIHYIATRFGKEALRLILENWWKNDRFDVVLEKSIGLTSAELSDDWKEYLRRRYYPTVLYRRRIDEIAEPLCTKKLSFETCPVIVNDAKCGERVFCIGFGLGTIDLFELTRDGKEEWRRKTLIKGGRSTKFEQIPLLRSRLSAKGDTLLFVSKVGERDAIYLLDTKNRKVLDRIFFEGARILNSPAPSPDGRFIAFSAIDNNGKSDLFIYHTETEQFSRLTDDYYEDVHPDWHPHRDLIVFSSDRCPEGMNGKYAIYTIDTGTKKILALTEGKSVDKDPRWLHDGSGLLFSSDRKGVFDIYLLKEAKIIQQTNILGGAFIPTPCTKGNSFLTAAFSNGTYHIYRVPLKNDSKGEALEVTSNTDESWLLDSPDHFLDIEKKDYSVRFGLDFIGAAFAADPDFGYLGNAAQLFFTDMLGNHQLMLLFGTASDDFHGIWKNLNIAVTYVNLSSRLNYILGAFHLASYMSSAYDLFRFERRYGVQGGISYPISKFTRVDLSGVFKWMERDDDITYIGIQEGSSLLLSSYLSFTTDNIIWYIGGPASGRRLNIAVGNTIDINGSRYESTTLHFDLRHYINLSPRYIFAQRFVSRNAWGSDIQLFYLGGSFDLRGYHYREYAGKRILLLNNELRFPLIDRFVLKFPVGNIELPLFRGSLFFDIGKVNGFLYDTGWLGSYGAGVEMNLGYFPIIRVNFSKLTDFETTTSGVRIDFFIGFNF